ncbi:hypothetical protein KC726_02605 [Candidatus Woesebacteria bacterium]|nr:hypothetical protein [Candidatus Woesebacteria bacterium]
MTQTHMKKRIILSLSILSILFLFVSGTVSAQQKNDAAIIGPPIPPVDNEQFPVMSQDHAYTVYFRGNGEAVVNLRVAFINTQSATQSAVTLRLPKIQTTDLLVYQAIRSPQCVRYAPSPESISGSVVERSPTCLQYQEPDYYNFWYGETTFKKAHVSLQPDGNTLIDLPQAIAPEKSGSFVVYFRTNGFTKRNIFGAYEYNFETLTSDKIIRNLTVGIETEQDYLLKGARAKTNYTFAEPKELSAVVEQGTVMPSIANQSFDTYYQRIGLGRITKTSANLQANESFTVSGAYADFPFRLYGKELSMTIFVIVSIAVLVIVAALSILRKKQGDTTESQKKKATLVKNFLISSLAAFVSAACAEIYTIIVFSVLIFFTASSLGNLFIFVIFLILGFSFIVYPFIIFAPSVVIWKKKGMTWGLITATMTLFWFFFACIITLLIIYLFFQSSSIMPYPTILY